MTEFKTQGTKKIKDDLKFDLTETKHQKTLQQTQNNFGTFQTLASLTEHSESKYPVTKPPKGNRKIKRKTSPNFFSHTQSSFLPQPRSMLFLKKEDYALSEKQIIKIRKQRCTPLKGSTFPTKPLHVKLTDDEKKARKMERMALAKARVDARRQINEHVRKNIAHMN